MYRIPALIYIKENETFLAFAEKRTSLNDVDAKNLVVKRGIKQNGSIKWSPLEELPDAGLEGYRTMNPCPVYENISKSVFLFFICVFDKVTEKEQIDSRKNRARLCYVVSQDGGNSWSKTTDLTEAVIGEEIKNWATFAVGPGHGIQMSSNRLIIPAYMYYITCCCVKPYAFAFYSDDSGESWHYGEKLSKESLECEMAEITDDTGNKILYCNARSTRGCRVEAWSKDQGNTFEASYNCNLVEPCHGCQGSVVSFTDKQNKSCLLYSHTTDKCKRLNLGIYHNKTPLEPNGWSKPQIINSGLSGYSDSAQSGDKYFCLMERGTNDVEEICFLEFSLDEIMKGE
ncbi:sialidase 3 (membrane sialidase), tandem duplicate 1 [Silurus meridionalis]|nr:sialidase 3 (membrane sialidase), tandem duplicate 1 [Silurus meridionalis]